MERPRLGPRTLTQIPTTVQGEAPSQGRTETSWRRDQLCLDGGSQGRGGEGRRASHAKTGVQRYMAHPRCVPGFPPCPVAQLVSHGAGDLPFGFCSLCDLLENGGGGALEFRAPAEPPGGWFAREVSTHDLLTAQGCAGVWGRT